MSNITSSNSTDDWDISPEISLPRSIRFWLILLFDVPSLLCSFCLLFHILNDRTQRHALYTHTILVLLIANLPIQLLDAGLYLSVLHNGVVQPSEPIVCLFWMFADNGFYALGINLLTWLAIERHILIFHDRWVANRRGRFLFHYFPLFFIITYIFLFYIIGIFILPCDNVYNYSALYCGVYPCLEWNDFLNTWETVVHYCVPVILESIVSTGLLVRVQWQKRRLRQSIQWRKQRRMIIQLLLISGINIPLNLPLYIIYIAQYCGLHWDISLQPKLWFYFLSYSVILFFPFASLCQFPALRKQMRKKFCCIIDRSPCHPPINPQQ
ncbi:unnamed protein product [Adineta ricciae]|uniref:G-protein coupled receptors family 1 profile domain-containing protein n=1 Tax=Adineta ricciae TaxID=249248 RepID=A0A814Z4R7_ADIRI|nr:unnamed protein product [Adineta ricciae]CAF1238128.1 unnamed protein product [Adineta ricciae]